MTLMDYGLMKYHIDRTKLLPHYNHIISLGYTCASAIAIRAANMRTEAFPFDWCSCLRFKNVVDAIMNEFVDYLPSDMKGIVNRYNIGFPHLPSSDNSVNHITFLRRTNRFMDILKGRDSVLFVCTNETYIFDSSFRKDTADLQWESIKELNCYIRKTYPQLNYQILYVDFIERESEDRVITAYVPLDESLIFNEHSSRIDKSVFNYRYIVSAILKDLVKYVNNNSPTNNLFD